MTFKTIISSLLLITLVQSPNFLKAQSDEDVEKVGDIFDNVLTQSTCYNWLHYLCKNVGHRIAGSPAGAAAVEYTRQMLDTMGCDKVWLQPVKVPYWTRGNIAECRIINSATVGTLDLNVVALGYSAATDLVGISGEVIEVKSVGELEKMDAAKVKGKIVFFNAAMDPTKISTFTAYGEAGHQRTAGPKKAQEKGAIAAIVRSLTLKADDVPHSGVTIFDSGKEIPAVGIGIQSAERLSALLKKETGTKVFIRLDCKKHGEQMTYNVIGEIKGSVYPDKIILVGGHIDSWDIGEGAHDDGAGCVQSMEVLNVFKRLGIKPKHTIRCVLFANEENGLRGGSTYAEEAKKKGEKHVAAIESDGGGHAPRGFGMDATTELLKGAYAKAQKWREVLAPYGFYELVTGGSGADIGPLKNQDVVLFGYRPDSQRYFDYHHTANDVFENVHKRELELGAAGIAALVFLIDKYGF
jgi:Zn-dependent M28 family amino/carboxypeptidase